MKFWLEGNGPRHFYKFRDVSKYTKKVIVDGELYFGSADEFNDPFDFFPNFTMTADRKSLQKYIESALNDLPRAERRKTAARILSDPKFSEYQEQAIDVAKGELETVRRNSGLLCLASQPDHMLLWAHYANSHQGIALRFKPMKGDQYFEYACEVTYKRKREKLNLVLHDTMKLHKLALLTKAEFWSYEEEWRIVREPGSKGTHKFPAASLDAIIFGAKIPEAREHEVRNWVAESGRTVEWLRARVHKEEFSLEVGPC